MNSDCIFCKIIARQASAVFVYENAGAVAFLDLNQNPKGHMLVVTKKHCRNIFDIDDESGRAVMRAARVVANALRAALNADGLTVSQRNERAGGQDVFHFHMHLFPRYHNDDPSARGFQPAGADEMEATARKIGAKIADN
ncbi:MAG: HIT family protein [Chloroflexi bacterium]|nr:HIT family protein [Chloroflexota bacterium]